MTSCESLEKKICGEAPTTSQMVHRIKSILAAENYYPEHVIMADCVPGSCITATVYAPLRGTHKLQTYAS